MSHRVLLLSVSAILVWGGCRRSRLHEPADLGAAGTRRQAARILAAIGPHVAKSPAALDRLLTSLTGHLERHPNWLPRVTLEKLVLLHDNAAESVERAMIQYLEHWPCKGYYPLRDDPAAVLAVDRLVAWGRGADVLKVAIPLVQRITVEDPSAKVRLALAAVIPTFPAGPARASLLGQFLLDPKARYTLFKAAARATGELGVADVRTVPLFIRGLFTERAGISASVESAFALGTSQGPAADLTRDLLRRLALRARDVVDGAILCQRLFPKYHKEICPLFPEARRRGWLRQDPIYFENTALRVLAHRGDRDIVLEVVKATNLKAFLKRWRAFMDRFSRPGDGGRREPGMLVTLFDASALPFFGRDLSLRSEALQLAATGGYLPPSVLDDAEQGGWTHFGLPTYAAAALMPSTPVDIQKFKDAVTKGVCHITAGRYYAVIRAQALNAALASDEDAQALSRAWNREVTTRGQWSATRRWWQPRMMKELGGFGDCLSDVGRCLSPHELYRLEVLKYAWYHLPVDAVSWLSRLSAGDLMTVQRPPAILGALEGFVDRPWDDAWEARRREGATRVLQRELKRLSAVGALLSRCGRRSDCYVHELRKSDILPPVRAKAARMLMELLGGTDVADYYELLTPRERAVALEHFRGLSAAAPQWRILKKVIDKIDAKGVDIANALKFRILYARARRTP